MITNNKTMPLPLTPEDYIRTFFVPYDNEIAQLVDPYVASFPTEKQGQAKASISGVNIIYRHGDEEPDQDPQRRGLKERINDIRDKAMATFNAQLPTFIEMFPQLYSPDHDTSGYDKDAGLKPERRGRILEVPDILGGTGFTAWHTPFEPGEELIPHNHTVPVCAYTVAGTLEESSYILRDNTLTEIKEEINKQGHHSALFPREDNIHSYINNSTQPALALHFCFQCQHNGIDHPVREVFSDLSRARESDNSPEIGLWQVLPAQKNQEGFWVHTTGSDRIVGRELWRNIVEEGGGYGGYIKALRR